MFRIIYNKALPVTPLRLEEGFCFFGNRFAARCPSIFERIRFNKLLVGIAYLLFEALQIEVKKLWALLLITNIFSIIFAVTFLNISDDSRLAPYKKRCYWPFAA